MSLSGIFVEFIAHKYNDRNNIKGHTLSLIFADIAQQKEHNIPSNGQNMKANVKRM